MLSSITIKRNNHWLYHSEPSRRQEMLTQLISDYADKSILIAVSQQENLSLEEVENITVMTDDEIMSVDAQQFDIVIHANLPEKPLQYIKRLSCAKELSIGLLLAEESQLLYQIEILLGRTISQKYLEGFEPVKTVKEESPKQSDRTFREKKKFGKSADPSKRRQRNHHKDGTVRTEEERTEYQVRRAKSGMKQKSYHDKNASDEKGSRKPFDDKKKYDRKERSESDYKKRKPFDKKRDFDSKKNDRNSDNKLAEPKRKPRTFMIKASKKDEDK